MNKITFETAIEEFKKGKIGIFPTDTAFGIGCRIDNEVAVERLFELRRRPKNKPTPVLVASLEMAEEITKMSVSDSVRKLAEKYWPGGLTLVLPNSNDMISKLVVGELNTLGVRMPAYRDILVIIRELGIPILAPSANFAGEATPFSFEEINPDLLSLVDFYIEGASLGESASTVLDCTKKPFNILRQGAVIVDPKIL